MVEYKVQWATPDDATTRGIIMLYYRHYQEKAIGTLGTVASRVFVFLVYIAYILLSLDALHIKIFYAL